MTISEKIADKHLLNHPFYRAWECGALPREKLNRYAQAYYTHVSAFPRYISAIHSQIADLPTRQLLLENLIDEEQGPENHPELWLRFCEALGLSRQEILSAEPDEAVQTLVAKFMTLARTSGSAGLGALFAYESQIPAIAEFKLNALKKYYVAEENFEKLKFFEVHKTADVYHTQTLTRILEQLPAVEAEAAHSAAQNAAQSLWEFLDEMAA